MTETPLSEREQEILRLVATGASNKEISRDLHISINTVKVHLRNIFTKLEVMSRTEAAMWAVQNGLVATGRDETQIYTNGVSGVDRPSRWIDLIPSRVRPWILVSLAIVLIIGGFGIRLAITRSQEAAVSEEILSLVDQAEQSRWQQLADMPTARAGLAAAAYDNQIYAIAGEGIDGVLGVVERYDPPSDSWETRTTKPIPVADVHAGVIGGKIYIPGGRLADGGVTDILEIYDPRQDSWSLGEPLPKAISAYALATYEGRLYVFGGWDGENYLDEVYIYDPSQNNWSEAAPMPTARSYAGAAVSGEKIYVIGGFDGENALDVNEEYTSALDNGVDNPWNQKNPMPEGRYGMGVASVADKYYFWGGMSNSSNEFLVLELSTKTLEWTQITHPFQNAWTNMEVIGLGTQIISIGGLFDNLFASQNITYTAMYTVVLPIVGK